MSSFRPEWVRMIFRSAATGGTDQVVATGNPLPVTDSTRNNAFATLLNFLPDTTAKEVRRDETLTDDYHGRAPDGTATSAASWEIVRFYKDGLGNVTRARYRTGISWDGRAVGWT